MARRNRRVAERGLHQPHDQHIRRCQLKQLRSLVERRLANEQRVAVVQPVGVGRHDDDDCQDERKHAAAKPARRGTDAIAHADRPATTSAKISADRVRHS